MTSKITYDYCPCCGSAAISKDFECPDYSISNELFEIWKCSNCTFRFTQNVPDTEHISPYYQSAAYISHSDTKEGFINRLYHAVRSFTLGTKSSLVKNVTGLATGVLLDVGAGTGAFSATMKKAGWNVTGLEPDELARKNADTLYNMQLQELANLHNLPANTYDAITLWHVLEHVHDLHDYLEKFLEILKPAGRLIIAVPNHCSYDAKEYKQHWAAWDVPRHLYHFSPESMETLLGQKGFVLDMVKPMWFDSFYVSMLSEKYRGGSNHFISAAWVGLISNVKAIFNTGKCSSVIYVVKKK